VKLGRFPQMNLDEARDECRKVTKIVSTGGDPRRRNTDDMTGEDLVNEMTSHATWRIDRGETRADTLEGYLRRGFIPMCGDMRVKEIHSGHLMDVLEVYQRDGKLGAAGHMWNAMSLLWKFAIVHRFVDMSPMFGVVRPRGSAPRDRILSDGDLKLIWHKLGTDTYRQPAEHALAIRLLMLLPFRGMELIHGEWREIDFDKANWTVPTERVKTRSSGGGHFLMPLPPMALSLLDILRESTGENQYLFPAPIAGHGPIDVRVIGRFISRNREKG
jgi:integrase